MKYFTSILCFFIAILLYLSFHGAECRNINFSVNNANGRTYKTLIAELRRQLSIGTRKVYNITVLKHQVPPNQRFLYVNLINYDNQQITVAIDVLDVYVVGYLAGNKSYILRGVPAPAQDTSILFPNSSRTILRYSGSYPDLSAIGSSRIDLPLGLNELNSAITNMFRPSLTGASLPNAFLVVIQMVSEASRFKNIETILASNIDQYSSYYPDYFITSLQNNWGSLSSNIQEAQFNNGNFRFTVVLNTPLGGRREVTNVRDPVMNDLALLKYHKIGSLTDFEKEMHQAM